NNLRSIFNRYGPDGSKEVGVAVNVGDWVASQWHYIAFTWSRTNRLLNLYVDGTLRAQATRLTRWPPSIDAATFQLGAEGADSTLDGVVDELRISDTPRSAEEIARRYVAGLTVQSLSIQPTTLQLLETWWRTPTLTASTDQGLLNIPPSA